jgi:hypothetical protein
MAATDVSICSNALLQLGGLPFSSFTEADPTTSNLAQVRAAANLWPSVRAAVLRSHSWNCATKRVVLSPDTTPPVFGWDNRFLMPSDWLKTLQVGEFEDSRVTYRTEGRVFLCNDDAFYLVYVFDNLIAATYDAALVLALEKAMCAALAYPVTKSTSLRDSLLQELQALLAQARAADGQDDPPETLGDFRLLGSRFGAI